MSIRQQLQDELKTAMKERQEDRLSTLRMLWSQIRNSEIDKKHELDDSEILEVIGRSVKQLKDSINDFNTGGRTDLVAKTQTEVDLLETYLPAQLSDEELRTIVAKVLSENNLTDAGKAMGAVMKEVKGKADGNRVRQMVGEIIIKT